MTSVHGANFGSRLGFIAPPFLGMPRAQRCEAVLEVEPIGNARWRYPWARRLAWSGRAESLKKKKLWVGGIALSANPPTDLGGYLAGASGRFSGFLGTAYRD